MKLSTADLEVFFTPEHVELAARLERAAPDIARAAATGGDLLARSSAASRAMADHGLYELLVPEAAGGVAQDAPGAAAPAPATAAPRAAAPRVDLRALCLVREMLGHASPLADAVFAVHGLGSFPLCLAGTPAQKALAADLRSGAAVAAFALTEPDAGSDLASLSTWARRDGADFVLSGEKTLISSAGLATHYLVLATVDPKAGKQGITAFWVPARTRGLLVQPIALGVDHPIGAVRLDACRVPADAVVGEVGGGFALAMRTLDTFRVTVGAAAVGMARRAFDEARAHVGRRVQFGAPLSHTQLVQAHLADMLCDLDAARLLVLRAAHAADRGAESVTVPAAMAKLVATEAAQRVIDRAVQLLGGRGVVKGEVVEALYRAIRPLRIYEGTSEIQRLIIGRAIAKGRE